MSLKEIFQITLINILFLVLFYSLILFLFFFISYLFSLFYYLDFENSFWGFCRQILVSSSIFLQISFLFDKVTMIGLNLFFLFYLLITIYMLKQKLYK